MSRPLRALLFGLLGLLLAVAIGAVRAFGSVAGESVDPSQKARVLGQGISETMNLAVILVLAGIVIGAVTGARPPPNKPGGGG